MGFSLGNILGTVGSLIPGVGPVISGISSLFGGGGGEQQSSGGGLSGLGGILGLLGGSGILGGNAPEAPVWQMDAGAKKLYDQLNTRMGNDLNSPGGMTALDNVQLERLRHSTFGESLGRDAQRLYEQQTMRGIEGSHPAFQAHERLTKAADDRYWDSELALRQAARDRQFQLKDIAMGLVGAGNGQAANQYESEYNAWKDQQANWQKQQEAYGQLIPDSWKIF
jgi:hypothetical protein